MTSQSQGEVGLWFGKTALDSYSESKTGSFFGTGEIAKCRALITHR